MVCVYMRVGVHMYVCGWMDVSGPDEQKWVNTTETQYTSLNFYLFFFRTRGSSRKNSSRCASEVDAYMCTLMCGER